MCSDNNTKFYEEKIYYWLAEFFFPQAVSVVRKGSNSFSGSSPKKLPTIFNFIVENLVSRHEALAALNSQKLSS